MRTALFSSWTLFFGIFLFMAGNGLQGTLLGTTAERLNFGDIIIGIVMSGYFLGFLIGSLIVPKLLAQVGHVRVFGALAAMASASILIHSVFEFPSVWFLMRVITGFAYSGMYIVAESWINEKATNNTRGTLLSVYMIVNMLGLMIGQLLISASQGGYAAFIIVSVLVSISVIPILITAAKAPEFQEVERVSLRKVYSISPLAFYGMLFHGMTSSVIFAMGAVYAFKIGLTLNQVGIFMAAVMLGSLVLQYPVGSISDRIDRRTLILILQILVTLSAMLSLFAEQFGFYWMVAAAFLYGGLHTPLYSLYIAHANDYLTPRQIVATASMLLMINGIGAIFGTPIVGYFISVFSVSAFFPTMAVMHLIMSIIVIIRMLSRPAMPVEAQAPFVAMPKSPTPVATTLHPEAEWVEEETEEAETAQSQ